MAIHAVEEQPLPHLVMEYIPGQTLQQQLDQTGPLEVPEILRLGQQIATGLAAAHAMGLIHRDIKPSNILLESGVEPRVKITDFGLARTVDDASVTQSGVIAGTPMYMSPEQANGEVVDQRTDRFSLGSVLYMMCTGRPPFRASSTLAVLKRVTEDTPRPIHAIIPEIPEWLCAIVTRLHARKPADRFATAQEVADLLGQRLADVQAGRVVESQAEPRQEGRPTSATSAPASALWLRQRRAAAAGLGVIGVMFLAAGLMVFQLPAEQVKPAGVQWLLASLALGTLLVSAFLASDSLRWRWSATLCLAVFGLAAAFHYWSQPATLTLLFRHPTARVVLESADLERREFSKQKPNQGAAFVHLDPGRYRLSVFVADKLLEREEIVLTAGATLDRVIEPRGRLQVINESAAAVTVRLVVPGLPAPLGNEALQKSTRFVVGPRSAVVDAVLAGPYEWTFRDQPGVLGKVGNDCFVTPGQTAILRIPAREAERS